MKKEYTKPNMEIVSFATENIATIANPSTPITTTNSLQTSFTTINY